MKIRYEAQDGKIFDTEQECKQYEIETAKFVERVKSVIKELRYFCSNTQCSNCPFCNKDDICYFTDRPCNW